MKQQRISYAKGDVKKVNRKQRNKHGHCGLMLCGQVLLTYMCGGRMCCNQEAREANVKMRLYTGEPGGRKSVVGYKKNIELNTEKVWGWKILRKKVFFYIKKALFFGVASFFFFMKISLNDLLVCLQNVTKLLNWTHSKSLRKTINQVTKGALTTTQMKKTINNQFERPFFLL